VGVRIGSAEAKSPFGGFRAPRARIGVWTRSAEAKPLIRAFDSRQQDRKRVASLHAQQELGS